MRVVLKALGLGVLLCASACVTPGSGVDAGQDAGLEVDAGPGDSGQVDAGNLDHGAPSSTYPAFNIDWPQLKGSDAGVIGSPRFVAATFDGDTLRGQVETFVATIGISTYWQTTTAEYGIGAATSATPVHLAGPAPTLLNDADIQTFLSQQLDGTHAEWPVPDGRTLYLLYYPDTTSIDLGGFRSCLNFGGYHNGFQLNGVLVPYAVMPRCAANPNVPALSTELGTLTGVTAHELIEAVTDADPSSTSGYRLPGSAHLAFVTFAGAETGDMCEFDPSAFIFDAQLNATVQRTWSNVEAAAGREPCIPAGAATHAVGVPVMTEDVPITFNGASLMSKGVRLRPGESKTVQVLLVSSADTQGAFTLNAKDRLEFFGTGKALSFSFDRTQGVNGEKVYLTITRVGSDPNFGGAIPFTIIATRGATKSYWFALVGAVP